MGKYQFEKENFKKKKKKKKFWGKPCMRGFQSPNAPQVGEELSSGDVF